MKTIYCPPELTFDSGLYKRILIARGDYPFFAHGTVYYYCDDLRHQFGLGKVRIL